MNIQYATEADAEPLVSLRNAVAQDLKRRYGRGHWSQLTSDKNVPTNIRTSIVLIARKENEIAGTLRLTTKRPWAIKPEYFVKVEKPVYLLDMAVRPDLQHKGIGRNLIEAARSEVLLMQKNAIRLDTYDEEAGAGDFYRKCGFNEVSRVVYRGTPLIYYEWVVDYKENR